MTEDKDKLHQIDMHFKDIEAAINTLSAEMNGIRTSLDEKHARSRQMLEDKLAPVLVRLSSLENAHRDVAKELQSFSGNYIKVLALIEAAKNDITALQAEDKKIEGTLSKVAWFVFPLLVTIIGFLLVQQLFKG
jgi:chromosome segregation ATPase